MTDTPIEALVARLRKADHGYEPGTLFTTAADTLTAQAAELAQVKADLHRITDMDPHAFGAQARLIEARTIAAAALARIGGE